ncbi:MAG: hypothetical protein AB7N76_07130 [Planctomycetota bacterium]
MSAQERPPSKQGPAREAEGKERRQKDGEEQEEGKEKPYVGQRVGEVLDEVLGEALKLKLRLPVAIPKIPIPPPLDGEYHTPLAGKELHTEVFGEQVDIPARDRRELLALSVGGTVFVPNVAGQVGVPFAAFFYRRYWDSGTVRGVFSGVVNDADFAQDIGLWKGVRFVAHAETNTIPFPTTEVLDGQEFTASEALWGGGEVWLGGGWRMPIAPHEVDNDLRVECYYSAGAQYFYRTHNTGARFVLPRNTYVHGLRFQVRLDAIQRNLLELPHDGFALGADVGYLRRDRWRDAGIIGPDGLPESKRSDVRDFLKFSAYGVWVTGVPFLSERHRLVLQAHGAWAPPEDLDRYSSFRIGGGPPTTEANDLARSPYPGANFNQFVVQYYAVASFEYRLEVLFFLYLHFRATLAWGKIPTLREVPGKLTFVKTRGEAYSVAVSSGFLWDSSVYLEYTYDSGAVRAGDAGHTILFSWSKAF